MALSDLVNMTLSSQGAALTRPGFGKALILSQDTPGGFTSRYREYASLAAFAVDFATTSATYLMAAKVFAQSPRPPLVGVGRRANKSTQKFLLTPTGSPVTGQVFAGSLDGKPFSFTVGGTQTIAAVVTGLVSAINALSLTGSGMTASDTGSAGTTVTVVANTAGQFHALSVTPLQTLTLTVAQTHADPGVADDLVAIAAENTTWYMVLNPFNSKAEIVAIDGWVESNGTKMFLAQTQDSAVINIAPATGSDVAVTLAGTTALRTALIFKSSTDDFADAAWAGACLPLSAGSETWGFHTLVNVPAESGLFALSETQRNNAVGSATSGTAGKYCNVYELIAGVNVTESGYVSGNEWIDIIRFRDWLQVNMSLDVLQTLINASSTGGKIPYTDAGIAAVQAAIMARLKAGIAAGGLSNSPAPAVSVPLASSVSSGDRAARVLNNVTFTAQLAGAIQAANISGALSF